MLTVLLVVLSAIALAAAAFLYIRLQRQAADHRQLNATHQQLAREQEDFKTRYGAVLDVEVEKARVLQSFESERAKVQSDIANALEERRRVVRDLEAEKERARVQVDAAAQGRREELLAEQRRLEGIIAQIQINQ